MLFFFVFAVEVACWLKKNHKRNTFVSIFFCFDFFEIGKIWTVNREYLGLSKGKKIIRQKKGIFNFFSLLSNGIKTFNQMIFFTCWMFWKVVCSSNKVRVRNNNYHNYKSFSSLHMWKKERTKDFCGCCCC